MGRPEQIDPIIACSTSTASNAALGVIRISGFSDITQFAPTLMPGSIEPGDSGCGPIEPHGLVRPNWLGSIEPRRFYRTKIFDGGNLIDDALMVFFKAPASYSGENLLEIHCHGNTLLIERLLDLLTQNYNLRPAREGEFTYRALKNKKISLSQVEGLDLVLNSVNMFMVLQGQLVLSGQLQNEYDDLRGLFLNLRSSLELNIDFLEDVGETQAVSVFQRDFKAFFAKVSELYGRSQREVNSLFNPEISLIGPTNAGKSSLFNRMLSSKRSIVSATPGTTRDYISEGLKIGGNHFKLIDTAGLRGSSNQSHDSIELEGIVSSLKLAKNSFFKIFVLNPLANEDFSELGALFRSNGFDLVCFTHKDLPGFSEARNTLLSAFGGESVTCIDVSCNPIIITDQNGQEIQQIFEKVQDKYTEIQRQRPISIPRHRQVLNKIFLQSQELQLRIGQFLESDPAIIAGEINILDNLIQELIGVTTPDNALNNIFSNFCIGK